MTKIIKQLDELKEFSIQIQRNSKGWMVSARGEQYPCKECKQMVWPHSVKTREFLEEAVEEVYFDITEKRYLDK